MKKLENIFRLRLAIQWILMKANTREYLYNEFKKTFIQPSPTTQHPALIRHYLSYTPLTGSLQKLRNVQWWMKCSTSPPVMQKNRDVNLIITDLFTIKTFVATCLWIEITIFKTTADTCGWSLFIQRFYLFYLSALNSICN